MSEKQKNDNEPSQHNNDKSPQSSQIKDGQENVSVLTFKGDENSGCYQKTKSKSLKAEVQNMTEIEGNLFNIEKEDSSKQDQDFVTNEIKLRNLHYEEKSIYPLMWIKPKVEVKNKRKKIKKATETMAKEIVIEEHSKTSLLHENNPILIEVLENSKPVPLNKELGEKDGQDENQIDYNNEYLIQNIQHILDIEVIKLQRIAITESREFQKRIFSNISNFLMFEFTT